jgi:hypothetical protein
MIYEQEKLNRWARKRLERAGIKRTDEAVRLLTQFADATQYRREARDREMAIEEEAYELYRADLRRYPLLCW